VPETKNQCDEANLTQSKYSEVINAAHLGQIERFQKYL
jgi:hypothetical protein